MREMGTEERKEEKRSFLIAGFFSFLFAAALLFGARLDSVENVDVRDWRLWASILVLTVVFTALVRLLWRLFDLAQAKVAAGNTKAGEKAFPGKRMPDKIAHVLEWTDRHIVLLSFVVLFLCWLPVFLAVYPGFFVYDAQDEYVQVASRTFSTHHPLVHVLLLGGMVCGVHKLTGSYNLGIACYTVLQMAVVAGGFAFLFWYLRERRISRGIRLFGLFYLGLFPTVVMFTLCSAKDALFTTALLLLMICLLEMGAQERFFTSRGWRLLFVLSGMAMMLFRNNGFYAFLVMIPFLLFLQKKQWRQILFLTACAVAGCLFVNVGLKTVLHAVKYRFDNAAFAEDKAKYGSLWLRTGMKKPLIYLNAWFMTSYGFWYPDTVINVYGGNTVFTFTYKDNSYFGYEVEEPGVRESKIPWLDEIYRRLSLEVWKEKAPVVSWLFSPGAMFWFIAFLFTWMLNRRRYEIMYPFLPVFLLWLTVLLGPTYLPRYVLFLWYGLPLFLGMAAMKRHLL